MEYYFLLQPGLYTQNIGHGDHQATPLQQGLLRRGRTVAL